MGYVLMVHSILRWVIVGVSIIALVKFLIGWLGKQKFTKMDRGLSSGFAGLMDLQVVIGLFMLLVDGFGPIGFPMHRIEHAFALIVAALVAHLPMRWKNSPDAVRFRNTFFCILIALALVYAGVMVLPGGWSR